MLRLSSRNGAVENPASQESEFGWAVVTRHNASEQDGFWPGGSAPGEVKQDLFKI